MKIKICLAADANYMQHLVVTMSSVLMHAEESDSLDFLILTDGSLETEELRGKSYPRECNIEVVNAAELVWENLDIKNNHNPRWSVAAYYRLILPELCREDTRIIYLDCDIIVRSSLAALWNMELNEAIAGVIDVGFDHCARLAKANVELYNPYINSGVTVWNLERMRENDYSSILQQAISSYPIPDFADQDWINIMFDFDRKILPPCWNAMSHFFQSDCDETGPYTQTELNEVRANPKICHFTNIKPWTMTYTPHPYWPEYWECLKQTGFARQHYKGWLKSMFLSKPDSLVLRVGRMLRGH